jgi:hypothetical protein
VDVDTRIEQLLTRVDLIPLRHDAFGAQPLLDVLSTIDTTMNTYHYSAATKLVIQSVILCHIIERFRALPHQ